jgi:chemotaxis response regulator CheB
MAGASLEKIADKLGDEMYADLNGWRLYLRDMKADGGKTMAQVLAEAVASGDSLDAALQGNSIKLGGGKKTVPLSDVVPDNQIRNATRTLEDLDR